MGQKRITVLNESHADQVNSLRFEAYGRIKGFSSKKEFLGWTKMDSQCCVLGAWDGDRLVSTMRLLPAHHRNFVAFQLQCNWHRIAGGLQLKDEGADFKFPAAVLSKAGTLREYAGCGLNACLRYWALKISKQWNASYLLGTFIKGSPRENSVLRMGYQLFENPVSWKHFGYESSAPIWIAALNIQENFEKATAEIERMAGNTLQEFEWTGEFPKPSTFKQQLAVINDYMREREANKALDQQK